MLIVAVAVAACATAAAAGRDNVTRLDLGFDTSTPGTEASVPIVLEVPDNVNIGTTVSEVTFPRRLLSFLRAETRLPGVKVETKVRPNPDDAELSILTVTVKSPGPRLRTGTVASVAFQVARDAPATDPIKLGNVPHAFTIGSAPRPVAPIEGRPGEILLAATAPVTPCFFFMH